MIQVDGQWVIISFMLWTLIGFIFGFRFAEWFFRKYPQQIGVTDEQAMARFHKALIRFFRKLKAKIS